jgi:hypothetical protein
MILSYHNLAWSAGIFALRQSQIRVMMPALQNKPIGNI